MFGQRRDRHTDVGPRNRVGVTARQVPPSHDDDPRGTLLFSTTTCDGGLNLDCVLDVSGEDTRAPVTLAVLLPECAEMAEYETRLIDRWLADGKHVDVVLVLGKGEPKVQLIAGLTKVFLDLRGATGT